MKIHDLIEESGTISAREYAGKLGTFLAVVVERMGRKMPLTQAGEILDAELPEPAHQKIALAAYRDRSGEKVDYADI